MYYNWKSKENVVELLENIVTIGSILFWGIVIFYAYTQQMPRAQYGILFLGSMILIFITNELSTDIETSNWHHVFLLMVSAIVFTVSTVYLYLNFDALYTIRVGYAFEHEYILAGILTVTLLYLVYKAFGLNFLAIILVAIIYGYFGPYFPGVIEHGGFGIKRLLRIMVLEIEGFYGFINRLAAAWIALFLLYAGLLKGYDFFDLVFRIALRSARYIKSGVAQTAVVGSAAIGSVLGGQTSNAALSGSFTIPMMKDAKIKPSTAAGVEAVASSSGQMLPPVMGAGAFIMASLLGISYVDVLKAGLLPAIILVICIAIAVHFRVSSQIQTDEINTFEYLSGKLTIVERGLQTLKFGIPFILLIYWLGIKNWTIMTSALYTSVAMVASHIIFTFVTDYYRNVKFNENLELVNMLKSFIVKTIDGFRTGATILAPIAIILAAVNGVVDILMASGVPGKLSLVIMDITGGVLLIAAILSFIVCILLGLGMPTTAAYVIVALLVAPTLINQFAIAELAAHFFVFYAAVLAGLTPPIAITVAVTSKMSGAGFLESCYEAIAIAAPIFILPFSFIYNPELVSSVYDVTTLITSIIILFGALSLVYGINSNPQYNRWFVYLFNAYFIIAGVVVMVHPSIRTSSSLLLVSGVIYITFNQSIIKDTIHRIGSGLTVRRM